jgi:hypothetical protein
VSNKSKYYCHYFSAAQRSLENKQKGPKKIKVAIMTTFILVADQGKKKMLAVQPIVYKKSIKR